MELPDDVGADLAGGGQDPKGSRRRWSERVSEARRILPKTPGRERISGLALTPSRDGNVHGCSLSWACGPMWSDLGCCSNQ
jgi:hypothetical protein